jgi:hypothetical protein
VCSKKNITYTAHEFLTTFHTLSLTTWRLRAEGERERERGQKTFPNDANKI